MDTISLVQQHKSMKTRVPLVLYAIPVLYMQGVLRITRNEDGSYISNSPFNQKFSPEISTRDDIFLVCGQTSFGIKPLKLENNNTQFYYEIDNPDQQIIPATGTFNVEKKYPLYALDEMGQMQRVAIGATEAGLGKLRDQAQPINVIWNAAEVIYKLQEEVHNYKLDGKAPVTFDGRVKDVSWLKEQQEGMDAIASAMDLLKNEALRFDISPPITILQYTTQAHVLHIEGILSMLNIPPEEDDFIKALSPDKASNMHDDLTAKMNQAYNDTKNKFNESEKKEPDLDLVVPEEAISEENKKKPENPPGLEEEDKSSKNSGLLFDVLEPEPLASTTPSTIAPLVS
jgi:hypothetical protein